MKKIFLSIAIVILTVTFGCEMGAGSQSITVVNNESGYSFTAKYPKHKTDDVVTFLKDELAGNKIFSNAEVKQKGDVILKDGSKFYFEIQPGYTKIDFKKRDNSEENFQKLTELCMGIKAVLK
jgi:hypothetical protein